MIARLMCAAARAQTVDPIPVPTLDVQLFRPTPDGARTLLIETSETPARLGGGGRALVHYAHEPFVYEVGGQEFALLGGVTQLDLAALVGGAGWRLGVDVPVVLSSRSDLAAAGSGVGDLRATGRLVPIRLPDVVNLGLAGGISFPTSTVEEPLASNGPAGEAVVLVDRSFGPLTLGVNAGVRVGPAVLLDTADLDDAVVLRAAASWANPSGEGLALELSALPALSEPLSNRAATPAEWLLGAFFPIGGAWQARVAGGSGLTRGIGTPTVRIVTGLVVLPPARPADLDGDTLADRLDSCPAHPEDRDGVDDGDGCPEAPPSRTFRVIGPDGAPLPEARAALRREGSEPARVPLQFAQDLAPGRYVVTAEAPGHEPGELVFEVGADGHAEIAVPLAPMTTAPVRVTVAGPDGAALAPRVRVGGVALEGGVGALSPGADVPVWVELDGYATIERRVDLVAGRPLDLALTAVPARAALREDGVALFEPVAFDDGRAGVLGRSWPLLDEVAELLRARPDFAVRVEAHTGSAGAGPANLVLSDQRAAAVRAYLVSRGIPEAQVSAIGFGESRPLDPAATPEADARNARIEIRRAP